MNDISNKNWGLTDKEDDEPIRCVQKKPCKPNMEVEHGHHGPRRSVDPLSVAMVANPRRVGGIVLADYTLGTIIVSMSCFFLFSEETGMLQVD